MYHKDGAATHCFRFAKIGETQPDNHLGQWTTPKLVDWALLKEDIRDRLNNHDFGEANCSIDDRHFFSEIAKSPPDDYPAGTDWKRLSEEN